MKQLKQWNKIWKKYAISFKFWGQKVFFKMHLTGASGSQLNSMTVTQVLSGLAALKSSYQTYATNVVSFGCACSCPPDLLLVNWMFHFPIVSLLQHCLSIWQYFQPPSRPHTTYNYASLGLYYIQLHHLQGCVRQATWTAESIFCWLFSPPAFK